jgi:P27 family predicted phage terminase small subunit
MRGNPPVPLTLKLLKGNPGKRRLRTEIEPAIEAKVPEPPEFVTGYAAEEWRRLTPELHNLGLISVLDVSPLAAYCMAYARWREAEEALAAVAARDPLAHGLLTKTKDGNVRRNPLTTIAHEEAVSMVAFAGNFGMSPVARTRIAAGIGFQPPVPDPFEGLIG